MGYPSITGVQHGVLAFARRATDSWPQASPREWAIAEPVNGQTKDARGLRRFLLRGLEKLNGELHLIAATHKLLKFIRHR